ncbi:MAG: hypothetical protein GX433_10955 [Deltaproteobacteria bacterium]|nr:hypothetical protein [Deltaproteobacteria bacterium]
MRKKRVSFLRACKKTSSVFLQRRLDSGFRRNDKAYSQPSFRRKPESRQNREIVLLQAFRDCLKIPLLGSRTRFDSPLEGGVGGFFSGSPNLDTPQAPLKGGVLRQPLGGSARLRLEGFEHLHLRRFERLGFERLRPNARCTWFLGLALLFLLLSMSWVSSAYSGDADESARGAMSQGQVHAQTPAEPGYKLGIGDILTINVWREPILSGETFVRNDGKISMNLVGDVQAAGRTPMELRDEIQEKLSEFIENPVVTVTLKMATSQKYYVIGEVKSPGEYDLVTDITFLQAIARAGGFSEWADKDDIVLIRNGQKGEERIKINYKEIVKGKKPQQNILLQANDTIVVP